MATVYRCEQPLLGREAVVKVLHKLDDAEHQLRFSREGRLAARLDHPYAAHVYACGIEDDGLVWIAMELVHGISLRKRLDDGGPIPLDRFIPLFERLCEVVQAAHDHGIVHRDLKPANIMVLESGQILTPKLLDLGMAKLFGEACPMPGALGNFEDERTGEAECSDLTRSSRAVGTPTYMAPEQWMGLAATPATDVYALGLIAYEALSGRRPYRGTMTELGGQHCTAEVPLVGGSLPTGLNKIFQRAMAKHPDRRYPSARELAEALRAEADAQLVSQIRTAARAWHDRGRPDGLLWRDETLAELERWMDRSSRSGLTTSEIGFVETSQEAGIRALECATRVRVRARRFGAGLAAAMVIGIVAAVQWWAFYERRLAEQRADNAEHMAASIAMVAEVEQGRAALLHDDMPAAQQHLGEAWQRGDHSRATEFMFARATQPLRAELARLSGTGRMWSANWSPDGRWIVTTDDAGAQIWDGVTYVRLSTLPHDDVVYAAAWLTADRVVTVCGDGSVRIWNAARGGLIRELKLHGKSPRWYALSVHGDRVAAVGSKGAVAAAWDMSTGAVLVDLQLPPANWPSIAFSADGRWLAATGGGAVEVLDTTTWRAVVSLGDQVRALAWDPSGPRLLVGSATGEASIWSLPAGTGGPLHQLGEPVSAVAYSRGGTLASIGGEEGAELVFDSATDRILSQSNRLHAKISSLAFSADGQLAAAGVSGELAIGEAESGLPVEVLEGPKKQQLRAATFGVAGHRIIAASWDGTARVWSAESPYRKWSAAPQAAGCGFVGGVESDGRYLVVACEGHATRVWDTSQDRLLAELPAIDGGGAERVPYPAVSPRGNRAAIASGTSAEVYELPGGRLLRTVRRGTAVTALAFDGADLVTGDASGAVLVTRDDGTIAMESGCGAPIDALAVLAGGRVAAADARGRVHVAPAGPEINVGIRARMLRQSPDGRRLLVVAYYSEKAEPMILVDLDRGMLVKLEAPPAYTARWVAGGILSAHADGAARLWTANGAPIRTYIGGARFLADADLSPDGAMIVGGGGDGELHFWDTETGRPLWVVAAHKPYVMGLHFEGSGIVTRGAGGEVARWKIPSWDAALDAKFAAPLPI